MQLCLIGRRRRHPASTSTKHVKIPWGRWELLNMSAHNANCIPVDRGRRYRDRAGIDVDTASLQKRESGKHVSNFPIGAMGNV